MPTSRVIEAIAVTAELCGRTFSPAAAAMFAADLDGFSESAVLGALTRCRKEVKGLLTVADVVSRIDDGRPGVEQAWSMLPYGEDGSVVWCEEMAQAWGAALPLMRDGDRIAARMAFKETYTKLVAEARDRKIPPKWTASFGTDESGRQGALIEAVRQHRLPLEHALSLVPKDAAQGLLLSLGINEHPLLAPPNPENQKRVAALLCLVRKNAA